MNLNSGTQTRTLNEQLSFYERHASWIIFLGYLASQVMEFFFRGLASRKGGGEGFKFSSIGYFFFIPTQAYQATSGSIFAHTKKNQPLNLPNLVIRSIGFSIISYISSVLLFLGANLLFFQNPVYLFTSMNFWPSPSNDSILKIFSILTVLNFFKAFYTCILPLTIVLGRGWILVVEKVSQGILKLSFSFILGSDTVQYLLSQLLTNFIVTLIILLACINLSTILRDLQGDIPRVSVQEYVDKNGFLDSLLLTLVQKINVTIAFTWDTALFSRFLVHDPISVFAFKAFHSFHPFMEVFKGPMHAITPALRRESMTEGGNVKSLFFIILSVMVFFGLLIIFFTIFFPNITLHPLLGSSGVTRISHVFWILLSGVITFTVRGFNFILLSYGIISGNKLINFLPLIMNIMQMVFQAFSPTALFACIVGMIVSIIGFLFVIMIILRTPIRTR